MACGCSQEPDQGGSDRSALRIALILNATMFLVGGAAGWWAQSTGLLADALDMLADASAYALTLMAATRGSLFKRNAARWSGVLLCILGTSIVVDGPAWLVR